MPRYADYHRTVVGYHGTKRSVALRIVQGEAGFEPSENADDWLGHGIYFWEYAPEQAFLWAKHRKAVSGWDEEIAVLGSMIRLGNCFDLLDPENVKALDRFHKAYVHDLKAVGVKAPSNFRSRKTLNCQVFLYSYSALESESDDVPIDTCRAVFMPTDVGKEDKRLWKGSGINREAHIQICVRNSSCILGTWLAKPIGD